MTQTPDQPAKTFADAPFLRWLPITCSVTLMAMVAFVAARNMTELKDAISLRERTFKNILAAQSFQNNFIDLQRAMRGYVVLGDTNSLTLYESRVKFEQEQFSQLAELTRDNPVQQQRLKTLGSAMRAVFTYDQRMMALYHQQGSQAVVKSDATGESRAVTGYALDVLKAFTDEEQQLLDVRDVSERAKYHNAESLLVFGSVLAALLLILSNYMASHQLTHRQRIENKLRETLTLQNAIFNSANYAIVTTDKNGVVQSFNPSAEKILGYSAKEIIGQATTMLWRDPQEVAERAEKLSARLGHPVRPTFETIIAKVELDQVDAGEWTFIRKDGTRLPCSLVITALANANGDLTGYLGFFRDISERKHYEAEREKLVVELQAALAHVKTLSGLIPICGWCKKIRSDQGYMQTVEQYVLTHTDATFSHGMCPSCSEKFKDDITRANRKPSDAI